LEGTKGNTCRFLRTRKMLKKLWIIRKARAGKEPGLKAARKREMKDLP
jgi:hypothetical protein